MQAVQSKSLFAVVLLLVVAAASFLAGGEQTAPVNAAGTGTAVQTGTGILSGTITEAASGSSLAGIEVCAVGNSDGTYRCTQTGADGVYAFTGLPTGNYSVGVDEGTWASEFYNSVPGLDYGPTHIQLIDGQLVNGIDIALDPGGTVSGRVTDEAGNPLQGVQVRLNGRLEYFACTDSDGRYIMDGIRYEGRYFGMMEARVGQHCTNALPSYAIEYWQEKPSSDSAQVIEFTRDAPVVEHINFTLEPGGSISGVVTSTESGPPLEGIPVCAGPSHSLDQFCAQSAADGAYTIQGLSTYTEYVVSIQADGWAREFYDNRHTFQYITLVSVTAGQDTPGINFALEPGGVISGTVTGPDGLPIEGAGVTIGTGTKTDANGDYHFASLPYDVYFKAYTRVYDERGHLLYNTEYWQENPWYGDDLRLTSDTPERNDIGFTLESLGAITGTVRGWSGEALADQMVCRDAEHDNWSYLDRCAYTDSYGRYTLIVPYDYFWVYTFDRASKYVYYADTDIPGDMDQVVVRYGETVNGIDLVTDPCFQASDGTLLNEVALNWCVAAGADHFEVYRTPPQGNAERIGTTMGIAYNDTSAIPGVRYTYQVKACTGGICSDYSAPDSGWSNTVVSSGDYDDSFNLIGYEGVWEVLNGAQYSNDSLHVSHTRGNEAILFFRGNCASVSYITGTYFGRISIYIDEEAVYEFFQSSSTPDIQIQTEPLCVDYGIHKLRLVHSMGNPVNIDGISITVLYDHKIYVPLLW